MYASLSLPDPARHQQPPAAPPPETTAFDHSCAEEAVAASLLCSANRLISQLDRLDGGCLLIDSHPSWSHIRLAGPMCIAAQGGL